LSGTISTVYSKTIIPPLRFILQTPV